MIEYYKVLGLKEGASQEAIQEAYERLSKELDPISNGNTDFFIEEYTKLQEAYNELRNSSILSSNIHKPKVVIKDSQLDSISKPNLKVANSQSKRKKYFWITLFVFFLLGISSILFYLYSPVVTNWYYEKGNEKYDKKEYKAAISYYNEAIERNATNYVYFKIRAISKELLKNYKGALHDYNKAILLNPNNDTLYAYRGDIRCTMGDVVGGFSDFEKGLILNPKSSILFEFRAISKSNLKDNRGAIEDYNRAILLFPSSDNYFRRGKIKSELKDENGAILDFTYSIDKYKEYPGQLYEYAFSRRAKCYYNIGWYTNAIYCYTEAIELRKNKDFFDFYYRGSSKFELKDYRGAINDYTECIKLNPNVPGPYFDIGAAYDNLNNINKACEFYSKAGELGDKEAYDRIKTNCN